MKKMNKKGQGAMEYLMTYGWAILVVMIVGVVLWQLGVFKVGQTSTVTTGWTKLSPLSSSIVYPSGTENFSVQFNNMNGVPIRIRVVAANESVSGQVCETSVDDVLTTTGDTLDDVVTTGAGNTFRVNADCTGANKNAQDTYTMTLKITYDSVLGSSTTEHIETGTIQGPAE